MEKTPRLQEFISKGGLIEVSKDSPEYEEYLAWEEAQAKAAATAKPKTKKRQTIAESFKDGFKAAISELEQEKKNEANGNTEAAEPTAEEMEAAAAEKAAHDKKTSNKKSN